MTVPRGFIDLQSQNSDSVRFKIGIEFKNPKWFRLEEFHPNSLGGGPLHRSQGRWTGLTRREQDSWAVDLRLPRRRILASAWTTFRGCPIGPAGRGRAPTAYLSSDRRRDLGSGPPSAESGSGIGLDHVPELPTERHCIKFF